MKLNLRSCLLAFFLAATVAQGEYLSVEEAGFRNCALIYYNKRADVDYFKPILVKYQHDKPTAQRGYDSFLFLVFTLPNSGRRTEVDPTDKKDWTFILDAYFGQDINVPALNTAAGQLRKDGFLPKGKTKLMFAIPWLNPGLRDFGDVDGDGKTEDLSTVEGREKVLGWYMGSVIEQMKKYPELELWGFYMMREGLGAKDTGIAKQYCQAIHRHGAKAFWIPYYMASGCEHCYDELGFDVVIMQSNWTFGIHPNGAGARRNRLVNAAEYARNNRMGIELEINPPPGANWRRIFEQTLETGTQTGFQKAPSATYFGEDFYWARSKDPAEQALYALWMDYLAGKPIRLPALGKWTRKNSRDGSAEITYTLNSPAPVQLVDIFLKESADNFFAGLVAVESRLSKNDAWKPEAWARRSAFDSSKRENQNITVELPGGTVRELRIKMTPASGRRVGKITGIEPDLCAPAKILSKSYRKSYTTSKRSSAPKYPDETGRKLLDGITSGGWGKYVGFSHGARTSVALDFGETIEFDEVRVHLLDQPGAAIHLPSAVSAIYSNGQGEQRDSGFGAPPEGYDARGDFRYNPETKTTGLRLNRPGHARSMTLMFEHSAWLFLSEIQLLRNGQVLPNAEFTYSLSSQMDPGDGSEAQRYKDDGVMLTDGFVSPDNKHNVGMSGSGRKLRIVVDLSEPTQVRRATCYVVDGGNGGIMMPKAAVVRLSADKENWSQPIPIQLPAPQKRDHNVCLPVTADCHGATARFVEFDLTPAGWAFVSEVVVE
ncbi:MAG: DUF4855 domain-containing protein [Verrucomicrobia bacterium]|nr:DUF4855 domain-containing protein [Verrucomicrobiota bacterium]